MNNLQLIPLLIIPVCILYIAWLFYESTNYRNNSNKSNAYNKYYSNSLRNVEPATPEETEEMAVILREKYSDYRREKDNEVT